MSIERSSEIFPVIFYKNHILSAIKKFKIVFISAETGSGKTTIVPQILYKSGHFDKIIISQTRRIATISAAKFVSMKIGDKLGKKIGYSVRFDDLSTINTKIKFVTDGVLFREISRISFFRANSCIIIDEFHERTVYTDLILAILKSVLLSRKKINIIVMSASGNSKELANYLGERICKLSIPGKMHSVFIYFSNLPQKNFLYATILTILKIHISQKIPGDILVFLPGLDEITNVYSHLFLIFKKKISKVFLKRLHSSLSLEEQHSIFNEVPLGYRKIILSTNIAESSITIPGIVFVVDSGLAKQKILNWKTGVDMFRIFPISKSEAKQRAGRAGRQRTGKCFRMFTFLDFKHFFLFPKPNIQQAELSGTLLTLSTFRYRNLFDLDFITLPSRWEIIRSLELLFILGAIDNHLYVTFFGKLMSFFPIDLKMTKSIIESLKFQEKSVVVWVVSASSAYTANNFLAGKFYLEKKLKFLHNKGDFFFLAKLLLKFQIKKIKGASKIWCAQNSINEYFIENAFDIKKQMMAHCSILSWHFQRKKICRKSLSFFSKFKLCFVAGFFINFARKIENGGKYHGVISGLVLNIHPCSIYSFNTPKIIIFKETFLTTKTFIRGILPVKLIWLLLVGDKLFK